MKIFIKHQVHSQGPKLHLFLASGVGGAGVISPERCSIWLEGQVAHFLSFGGYQLESPITRRVLTKPDAWASSPRGSDVLGQGARPLTEGVQSHQGDPVCSRGAWTKKGYCNKSNQK